MHLQQMVPSPTGPTGASAVEIPSSTGVGGAAVARSDSSNSSMLLVESVWVGTGSIARGSILGRAGGRLSHTC